MSKLVNVVNDNFVQEVKEHNGVVLVDFWAEWCGPCKMLGPVLEELSEEVSAKICKVDVDKEQQLAAMFKIRSIPTMMVFKNGEKVADMIGFKPKDEIAAILKSFE